MTSKKRNKLIADSSITGILTAWSVLLSTGGSNNYLRRIASLRGFRYVPESLIMSFISANQFM